MLHESLLAFIPLFEEDRFRTAESIYLSSGEYLPEMVELLAAIEKSDLPLPEFNWLEWSDEASVFMRHTDSIAFTDFATVRKLFTVVAKADAFNRELLPFLCAKDVVYKLLLRLRSLEH